MFSRQEKMKVYIKANAAEAKFARLERRKADAKIRFLQKKREDVMRSTAAPELMPETPEHLRLMKSTADLQSYSQGYLRQDARIYYLAYGFLRGVPYAMIENQTHAWPDWSKVQAVATWFSEGEDIRTVAQKLQEWVDTGKAEARLVEKKAA